MIFTWWSSFNDLHWIIVSGSAPRLLWYVYVINSCVFSSISFESWFSDSLKYENEWQKFYSSIYLLWVSTNKCSEMTKNKDKDFHLSLDKVKWKVKVNYQVQRPWCALELGEETSVPSSILSFWKDNERKEQYPNPHLRKFLLQEFLIFSLFTCLPECNKWEGESLACFNL